MKDEILHGMTILLKEWEDAWAEGFPAGINSTRMMIFGSFMQLAREAREGCVIGGMPSCYSQGLPVINHCHYHSTWFPVGGSCPECNADAEVVK